VNTGLQIPDYSTEQATIDLLVKGVENFVQRLGKITTEDDARKAGMWRSKQIRAILNMVDDLFDESIRDAEEIRKKIIKQKSQLVNSKLSLAAPIKQLDDALKDMIETFLLEKQLQDDRDLLSSGDGSDGIDESILWERMTIAAENGEDGKVSELLALVNAHKRGELLSEEIQMGSKRGAKPVEGLPTRTTWTWEVNNIDKIKKQYLTTTVKKAIVNKLVTRFHKKAEELVGGIEVKSVVSSIRGRL